MATRTTDTMTISVPPAMVRQMERVQKEENRTRSELLREAWRVYFDSRSLSSYMPTQAERAAIAKGRADIKAGRFITLDTLIHDMEPGDFKPSRKNVRKATR